MNKIIDYVKRHWLILILIFLIVSLGKNQFLGYSSVVPMTGGGESQFESLSAVKTSGLNLPLISNRNYGSAAPSDSANRIIIQDTSLSLVVKNVSESMQKIQSETLKLSGFLVNSYLSQPESAASGNITVRVPEDKRSQALDIFKKISSKVISESVSGDDVTDQYVDIQSHLDILNQTKAKYEEIMSKAYSVTDLMNVQRELINLQTQIDSYKGQQKYLEQSAKLSKITIYLSTDELSLPYAPTNEWRPAVIFKEAVRSMLTTLRSFGSLIIWISVYLPIILPILGIIWFIRRRRQV